MQLNHVQVSKVHIIEASELGLGLEKISKTVLLHIKKNKKVYMQIGKVCFYGVLTASGLMFTEITGLAATTWADGISQKAEHLYNGLVQLFSWVILGKAIWDMACAVIREEARKAPSIALSYLMILGVLYALPIGMEAIKDLLAG